MVNRVLFASGDPGGARTLLPVVRMAQARGCDLAVLRNGAIVAEGDPAWRWLDLADPRAAGALLQAERPGVLVFASSVKDTVALTLARAARAAGIPVLHALDSWTAYRSRMEADGLSQFVPDVYAVPDQLALDDAAADGVPKRVLQVTGQPAFAAPGWSTPPKEASAAKDRCRVLYVSEPALADHGTSRGYTEHTSFDLLCKGLQPFADRLTVDVLPHPRHEKGLMEKLWETSHGALDGGVVAFDANSGALTRYDGVGGMASVLLYQAWLLGRPVISVQPNLQFEPLRQWSRRPGIVLVERADGGEDQVSAWAATIQPGRPIVLRPELALHKNAAERILSLAEQLAAGARQVDVS